MNINHISVSRSQVWNTCQYQYFYKYHLQAPSPAPTPIYFTFGSIVHIIIELFTKTRGKQDINSIIKDVLSGKTEISPGVKAPPLDVEYKNKLNKHINNFLKLSEKIGFDGDVEYRFRHDLDPPNGKCMYGFIDRVIRKDNNFFLIDFKTSKPGFWRKDSRTITSDLQLQCYCYIIMKEYGADPKNIQAALFFLDDYKLVPVRFSERTLLSVPERLLEVYNEIENMPPDKAYGHVGEHCKRCDWRTQCPWYSLI